MDVKKIGNFTITSISGEPVGVVVRSSRTYGDNTYDAVWETSPGKVNSQYVRNEEQGVALIRSALYTVDPDRKPSSFFTIRHNNVVRDGDDKAGPDLFKFVLDELSVEVIIDSLHNSDGLTASPDIGVATYYAMGDAKFLAYAYIHESGALHIWMEAVAYKDEIYFDDVLLATADFGWTYLEDWDEVAQLHQHYVSQVKSIMAKRYVEPVTVDA